MSESNKAAFTRRGFMGLAGGVGVGALLAACSGGGGSSSSGGSKGTIKFWNQPWGGTTFNPLDKKITLKYKGSDGGGASYQEIQWANFTQTYSTAVAANTGPAVSSGGGTQAFLFASQGKIAYADDLLDSWKKNGIYDDFLDGLVDTLKTDKGYAAVPYNLDMRLLWANTELMDKAGAEMPTDWDSYEAACAALKKIDVYGYGTYSGAGAFTGGHTLVSHMINNGGGLFDEDQQPNCVTSENIEAMNWVLGLVKNGYVDPRSVSYTSDNEQTQVKAGKFGMIWDGAGLAGNVGDYGSKLAVVSPLTGPSGKKGALFFPNNIMMYTNTPSQKDSEEFLTYYYKNMAPLWTQNTGIGLPPLKSIVQTDEFQANKNYVQIIEEWQPISKTWGAPGTNQVFLNVTAVDGTQPMTTFTQSILAGSTDAKSALTTLQTALKSAVKS